MVVELFPDLQLPGLDCEHFSMLITRDQHAINSRKDSRDNQQFVVPFDGQDWARRFSLKSANIDTSMQDDSMRSDGYRVVYQPSAVFLCGSQVNFNCFCRRICSGRSPSPSLVWKFVVRARVVIIFCSNISKNVSWGVRRSPLSYLTSETIGGIRTHPMLTPTRRVSRIQSLVNTRRLKFIANRYQMQMFLQVHLWQKLVTECDRLDRVIIQLVDVGDYHIWGDVAYRWAAL